MAVSCGRMADQRWEVSISGGHDGNGVGSDSGQILLDKFLYSCHLLQEDKGGKKTNRSEFHLSL